MNNEFEKVYVLDTNIVLADIKNLDILSQENSNLIVLPEIMLDEIDSKKSGFEILNYMAREFGRLLESAEIISTTRTTNGEVINRCFIGDSKNLTLDIISKERYASDADSSIERNIKNDRKIIEVALFADTFYKTDSIFVSLDVMCRQRAISLGLKTESLGREKEVPMEFHKEINISETDFNEFPNSFTLDSEKEVSSICLFDNSGDRKYYVKSGITFHLVDENELKKQNIKPKNIHQKIMSTLLLDPYYDVVVVNANAGTGKTALALSAAMKLIDQKMSPYDKIVYIRKTIISSDTELGFLPGDLDEKMAGFLAPLYSNLEAIAINKYDLGKKKLSEVEMQEKIKDMISDYRITSLWQGHLRGTTIRNAIIIYDEIQNDGISDIRTTISRIGENCKLFCLGSLRQIDNKYVNKYNSALSFLIKKIRQDNPINLVGTTLVTAVRSKMAEWADDFK